MAGRSLCGHTHAVSQEPEPEGLSAYDLTCRLRYNLTRLVSDDVDPAGSSRSSATPSDVSDYAFSP